MRVTKLMLAAALVALVMSAGFWVSKSAARTVADNDTANRLNAAADVVSDMMAAPDKGVPKDLLDKAACVVVVPSVKKAAFVIGAKYGRGFIVCRNKNGRGWSPPGGVRIEGGSVGFQIGGSATDVVMLLMNQGAIDKLLSSKFTIGADARRRRDRLVVQLRPRQMPSFTPSCLPTRERRDYSRASHSTARLCDPTMTRIRTCMASRCRTKM